MKFDVYNSAKTKAGLIRPSVKPCPTEWDTIKKWMASKANIDLIERFRGGDKDAKSQLPAVCFVGQCMKTRANKYMRPTQAVMLDVDHVENPKEAYEALSGIFMANEALKNWWYDNVLLWAITPSGHGLRGVVWAQPEDTAFGRIEPKDNKDFHSLERQMAYLNELFHLSKFGDFDEPCKDFSRISFFFKPDEILFENAQLFTEFTKKPEAILVNLDLDRKEQPLFDASGEAAKPANEKPSSKGEDDLPTYTDEEMATIQAIDYDGTPLVQIIEKYVEVYGKPGAMKVHNYYNTMIKYFRNIMNNDKRIIFALLPKFGHSDEECWSQINSICRSNTLSRLDKEFYFFLKDNGFYKGRSENGSLYQYMAADTPTEDKSSKKLPWLPPVIRELLGTAPDDFKLPLLDALLPIMGTLTSHVGARYYFGKNEYHTTSFFSVIYAPAGTGKGFCNDYMELLFSKIRQRDYIQTTREQIFLNEMSKKGANDKGQDDPHTSLRIIYPKNSEAEFLSKQKDNHGYHMFTFAAEMDSWAKGVKAAGGNKDDMLRIAWDNGDYGQNFKSFNTTKGGTKLYWNVLITGTLPQVLSYFKNVENGLVTRTSFCSIDNQEFAAPPKWRDLTARQKETIEKFVARCDERTYTKPCTLFPEDIDAISPKDFDKEVEWRFVFRPRQTVDMGWLKDTIVTWLAEQQKQSVKDYDKARDVFRRRVAVRGFRLGLMCTQLWESPRESDLKKCCPFIKWFMDEDMAQIMKLWAKSYNEIAQNDPKLTQTSVYNALPDKFTTNDVIAQSLKRGIKTPARNICSKWRKFGFIKNLGKNEYEKVKKNEEPKNPND